MLLFSVLITSLLYHGKSNLHHVVFTVIFRHYLPDFIFIEYIYLYMPISFLKKIKYREGSGSKHTRIEPSIHSKDQVEGFYVFPCKDMRSKQLLFNDGFPVMIFMPERHNRIKVTVEGRVTLMESVWLCGGILKNIYIDPLDEVEYLLIARFKPASFYKIFNLSPLHFKAQPICNLSEVLDDRHVSLNGWKEIS